ncbi:MAG: methenyltetrahydromethanopterin cyclohydrolase [Rickettsiales bacterium]|nr:methenyltetrahydromethanopterin cyclohydrolase [Rickettsiales bacterium]OUV54199.1 MAG: methenyltetrahydromethanopterin cyclohydrolase [Rickettsiales bacterium TMED127]|tara:strand:+ start:27475 stop:28425 length:951 start_codon:yes stop_codon:yes gene_type:complete
MSNYSFNKETELLVDKLLANKFKYGIEVRSGPLDCLIIDAGIEAKGSLAAGILISEICLGGLGKVTIMPNNFDLNSKWNININSSHPHLSCLGCQYAGWKLNHENFFSLGSGPARSLAQREEIFKELDYKDKNDKTVLVLEVSEIPPKEIIIKISEDCAIKPSNLCIILTPTNSMAGNIQIVARVLEVAIHKAHELNFPVEKIVDGIGTAPIPPVAKDMITGMGRTNDSIIYGGTVYLSISDNEENIQNLSQQLPSINSTDYGKPFKEIFKSYKGDFYKIDGSLFSPAKVIINCLETGRSFEHGKINLELMKKSFS